MVCNENTQMIVFLNAYSPEHGSISHEKFSYRARARKSPENTLLKESRKG